MDSITVTAPFTLKGTSMKSDKDGVPSLSITLEAIGTAVFERVNMGDLASLIGQEVLVSIRDKQLRLATGG
jgi:hypothetical protein